MYEGDFYDNKIDARITLTFEAWDDKANRVTKVERVLLNEDAEYLPKILDQFVNFLHGMTFVYVSGVQTFDEDGEVTHSSTF